MRLPLGVLALGKSAALAAQAGMIATRAFEDDRVGAAPAGFTFAEARGATPNRWTVQRVDQNNILGHLSDPARGGFSLAILDGVHKGELRLSVRLKLIDGERWRTNLAVPRRRELSRGVVESRRADGRRLPHHERQPGSNQERGQSRIGFRRMAYAQAGPGG